MLVTSVCSLKGGVGKTSVVLGLASAALARGVPTLIVDMDPQADATTGLDVALQPDGDIAAVLSTNRRSAFDSAIAPSGWGDGTPGLLDVLLGTPSVASLDSPRATERVLNRLGQALDRAEGYRLVLIDCPPSLNALTRTALIASHRALIVTEPALFSVAAADRALHAVDELRRTSAPNVQPLGVLVNRYRDRSPEHRYRLNELAEMFGPLVIGPQVPERSALQQAQGASRPIHQWPGPAAVELSGLFDAHLARLLRSATRTGRRRSPAEAI